MRIISGKYKGHQLISFTAEHIRPTTDRVKETLFNIIQGDIPEAIVLDLFSGTGNLGIEALSREAKETTFVENHPKSLELIRKNIEKLKLTELYFIINKDVIEFLKTPHSKKFDIILIDPPFTKQMADEVMLKLSQSFLFHENTIIAIESAKKEKLEQSYNSLCCIDQRHFGDKVLSFFRQK